MQVIESTIQREGGTHVEFGTTTYHFKPDTTGAHVAQVADEHAEVLLGIPEGYRLHKAVESTKPEATAALAAAQVLQGDSGSGEAVVADETQPPAEPNDTPAVEPVTEPVVEPVAEPVVEPVAEPVVAPVAKPKAKRAYAPRKSAK